jgi:hypothetical protein
MRWMMTRKWNYTISSLVKKSNNLHPIDDIQQNDQRSRKEDREKKKR